MNPSSVYGFRYVAGCERASACVSDSAVHEYFEHVVYSSVLVFAQYQSSIAEDVKHTRATVQINWSIVNGLYFDWRNESLTLCTPS